jgi:hypothetical protein
MENNLKLEYSKYKHLINDADILLFHYFPKCTTVGYWIAKYTNSPYSHVALAHWEENDIICLEFREFIGSRQYPLKQYLLDGARIDVFRATPSVEIPYIDFSNPDNPKAEVIRYDFTYDTAHKIIQTAHDLMGRRYSTWVIWQLVKTFIPLIRLGQDAHFIQGGNGTPSEQEFVCSTLISHSYRLHYADPVSFLSDSYTTPGDLARSELFIKLFEII